MAFFIPAIGAAAAKLGIGAKLASAVGMAKGLAGIGTAKAGTAALVPGANGSR